MTGKSLHLITKLLKIALVFYTVLFWQQAVMARQQKYYCGTATTAHGETVPATIVQTTSGEEFRFIRWTSRYFSRSGETPQARCESSSQKLQRYSDNSSLRYLTTNTINGLGVICIAKSEKKKCDPSSIIITLPPGIDRSDALSSLFDLRRVVAGHPLDLTDELVLYRNGEVYVDVDILINKFSSKKKN